MSRKMKDGDLDRRKRMKLFLVTDNQGPVRKLFCLRCGKDMHIEIVHHIAYATDAQHDGELNADSNGYVNVRCDGAYCRTWYSLHLRPKPYDNNGVRV